MSGVGKRAYLRDVNPYLICPLCRGYLIDATTVVECLHSFCRSCIIKHLNTEARCPSCKLALNKAKPDIKADQVLQDIVYKLVPGLYHKEMRRRREFYKKHPEHAESATSEQRGEDVSGRLIFTPEDAVSLSLEYLPPGADPIKILSCASEDNSVSNKSLLNNASNNNGQNVPSNRRYLQCPALVTIAHLKKFLALKYSIDVTRYTIEIYHSRAALPEHWTLMDVASIYAWRRNAPIRFFYRVAHEEQRLEAPPHDRPSTPGLGASLPPVDSNQANDEKENKKEENEKSENTTTSTSDNNENDKNNRIRKIIKRLVNNTSPMSSVSSVTTLNNSAIMVTSTIAGSTGTVSNTTPSVNASDEIKQQIKTPIKILKNPDGKYEVLRKPPSMCNGSELISNGTPPVKSLASPEFSVVSIGDGQNSNGVKITLKQCSPGGSNSNSINNSSGNNNNSTNNSTNNSKKPKVTSNILLRQSDKEITTALMLQRFHAEKTKQQQQQQQSQEKQQEKQKRRVTFMEKPLTATSTDTPKNSLKKPTEQNDKKQFLQSFQLTAKEFTADSVLPDSSSKLNSTTETSVPSSLLQKVSDKSPENIKTTNVLRTEEINKSSDGDNNTSTNKNKISEGSGTPSVTSSVGGSLRGNQKAPVLGVTSSSMKSALSTNNLSKLDVYTFPNDPPVVPAGAVKRKCPPGLPIYDVKRKRQQLHSSTNKKQANALQSPVKSPRKSTTEPNLPIKKLANVLPDPGPSRQCTPSPKVSTTASPMLSTDTRNLLDGCGLNIPASLSITLTAPKSPGSSNLSPESGDPKDVRKNMLGKVNPSITLNDRSVDPCVLKALKTGKMKMPAPPKPKQIKQTDRDASTPRQSLASKRKREQNSRDILDLSGNKKMDIHPLRIPQPVTKIKGKSMRESVPNIPDQSQVVTFMGHKYYRAPPGSLTPAACRMNDCPIPTPARTPVYAPTGLSTLGNGCSRTGNNLSSVFPSLQSLYALSQAPNLQQFQMDAKLRLPRSSDVASPTTSTVNVSNYNCSTPNKTHLAAQCAPVKPARSALISLAVPISKQSVGSSVVSQPVTANADASKSVSRNNQESENGTNHRSVSQSTFSPTARKSCSPPIEPTCLESNTKTEEQTSSAGTERSDNCLQESKHAEAASPRVSSTASPSPPPSHDNSSNANINDSIEANSATDNAAATLGTSTIDKLSACNSNCNSNNSGNCNDKNNSSNGNNGNSNNDVDNTKGNSNNDNEDGNKSAAPEVSSSKSPASPDSSSITVEVSTVKSSTEQTPPSPAKMDHELSDSPNKSTPSDDSVTESDKTRVHSSKSPETKQLTSEMLQKRLLAAFPSNEWANNPIAAEHLGNFLKSLNASIKSEDKVDNSNHCKKENQTSVSDEKHVNEDVLTKAKKEVEKKL
ncbi:polycomb group protein Psc-like [Prorops nasuta]|uniref:polycomb group protein Psc-like n=1 Tax=Prorops nasuta TaxID=863751 RepID=UPI0034CFFC7D